MGVTVIVPSFTVGQVVGVEVIFAVIGVLPAATLKLKVPTHPLTASLKVMVCAPAATLVNTLPAC